MQNRCAWVTTDSLYQQYHDKIWGRPVVDSRELFAKLCLDGQQAGLSWLTILKKQQNYERAFFDFDPSRIAGMDENDIEQLMLDKGIVRNRLKIQSIIKNARAYLVLQEQGVNFSDFLWQFTEGKTVVNQWSDKSQVPTTTNASDNMSKALKKAGFSFVGSTICYAFMQAVGMVNDHTTDCFCYADVVSKARKP
ncbi:DNA-3-methyladenine glycosylase I [Aestuariibacter salexigens]|uniref:DNA-3-methyladenine glycosylase I n=1 Tax=Aestuariibacter salexigens TaxID=226010 RepID=UPI000419C278